MAPRIPRDLQNKHVLSGGARITVAVLVPLCVLILFLALCTIPRCNRKKKTRRISAYTNRNYDDVSTSGSVLVTDTSTQSKAPVKPKRSHSVRGERSVSAPAANYENVFLDVYRGNFSVYNARPHPLGSASDTSDIPFIDGTKEDNSDARDNENKNNNINTVQDKAMYEENCDDVLENTTNTSVQEDLSIKHRSGDS